MKILLVHDRFPGPFLPLVRHLAQRPGVQLQAIGSPEATDVPGVPLHRFGPLRAPTPEMHWYLRPGERAVLHGQNTAGTALTLKQRGYTPDLILAQGDSGCALYLKDIFLDVPMVLFLDAFERSPADPRFTFGEGTDINHLARVRMANLNGLVSLEACDAAIVPTLWTYDRLPVELRRRAHVQHAGVDTALFQPKPDAAFALPDGRTLTAADPVVTVAADRLDLGAGLPTVLRALAGLRQARPELTLVMAGADVPAPKGAAQPSLREALVAELGLAPERTVAVGALPPERRAALMQVSRAHVHLNEPRVLGTSLLEAMACGCAVIASDTAPVREVALDGTNALLVDFFSPGPLAKRIVETLDDPTGAAGRRGAARATVLSRYDAARCTPILADLALAVLPAGLPVSAAVQTSKPSKPAKAAPSRK